MEGLVDLDDLIMPRLGVELHDRKFDALTSAPPRHP